MLITVCGKVFIDVLGVQLLAIGHVNKWYGSAYLGLKVQILGLIPAFALLVLLEFVERVSLRILVKNYVPMKV